MRLPYTLSQISRTKPQYLYVPCGRPPRRCGVYRVTAGRPPAARAGTRRQMNGNPSHPPRPPSFFLRPAICDTRVVLCRISSAQTIYLRFYLAALRLAWGSSELCVLHTRLATRPTRVANAKPIKTRSEITHIYMLPPRLGRMPLGCSNQQQRQQQQRWRQATLRAGPLLVASALVVALNVSTSTLLASATALPRSRWAGAPSTATGRLHDSTAAAVRQHHGQAARAVAVGVRCGATSSDGSEEDRNDSSLEVYGKEALANAVVHRSCRCART